MATDDQYIPPQPIPKWGDSGNSILGAHLGKTDYQLTIAQETVPHPLGSLLEAADADGTTVLCVYGSNVHLSGVGERLARYQFVNDLAEPLQSLSDTDRESVYVKLTALVEKAFLA